MEFGSIKLPKGATERERWVKMEDKVKDLESRIELLEKYLLPEKKTRGPRPEKSV